jgi:hypothetical protein
MMAFRGDVKKCPAVSGFDSAAGPTRRSVVSDTQKPITQQGDLAKLPRALAPLSARDQWCIWRWELTEKGRWQKPPFQARDPQRHASTSDPSTWATYSTALAAVQAGHGDGISYVLTTDDPFGAIDLDHCRCATTHSIDTWAQNWLDTGRNTYSEVTPSGEGIRIWGFADGDPVNKKYTLTIDDKSIAAEMFMRAPKALTITGLTLDPAIKKLGRIDKLIGWGITWGERRKAAAQAAAPIVGGNGFDSTGSKYSIEQIEEIVRAGAPTGADRSGVFHSVVGHYVGCGWQVDRILEHMSQYPDGIGGRYLGEDRLRREIERSAGKYNKPIELPLDLGWSPKAPPEPEPEQKKPPPAEDDLDEELDDDLDGGFGDEDDDLDEARPAADPALPRLYSHGDADPRPLRAWAIKNLMPVEGKGLLSGQWGAAKTFIGFELAMSLCTGQPFTGYTVKRQSGVLWIAAESAYDIRPRLQAIVREKCGGADRLPFKWYETSPKLLEKGGLKTLVAMAKQAETSLEEEFGLPLGLIVIDTITAAAGYQHRGDDNDAAVGQALLDTMGALADALKCFVLGVAHFGKDAATGTKGSGTKEDNADVVLVCLGDRELSGKMNNLRLAVRKTKIAQLGQVYPFDLRVVDLGQDEDGDAITTAVINWLPAGAADAASSPGVADPWAKPKRQDQRTAALRLKRVLMTILAEQGVDLSIEPDGPVVRMVDQKLVRKAYYACTPTDEGPPERKRKARHMQFVRAVAWAEDQRLIAITEIEDVTYLRLTRPSEEEGED